MERFQGPLISSCFFGEHLEVNSLVDRERLKLEEGDEQSSLEEDNNMPFLQMLQSPQFIPFDSAAWRRGSKTQVGTREPRKRKGTRETKKKEEVEKQRMTHIAVERNRRRQMNDHLSLLKSLMPPSYIQRGDHASIIGGAIDFVKELEQLLESLEVQKRMRRNEDVVSNSREDGYGMSSSTEEVNCAGDEMRAEKKSKTMAVEVTVIQSYVKLKIQCQRRPEDQGQLIKAVVALENLSLTILHLNITSSEATVLYSFNLKIEEDSKAVSASEIAEAVDHIFSCIN